MRTSSSSGDQVSADALRRLLRPFSLQSSTIAWYPGGARKRNARAIPGSCEYASSFSASSIISSTAGILRLALPFSTLLLTVLDDFMPFPRHLFPRLCAIAIDPRRPPPVWIHVAHPRALRQQSCSPLLPHPVQPVCGSSRCQLAF